MGVLLCCVPGMWYVVGISSCLESKRELAENENAKTSKAKHASWTLQGTTYVEYCRPGNQGKTPETNKKSQQKQTARIKSQQIACTGTPLFSRTPAVQLLWMESKSSVQQQRTTINKRPVGYYFRLINSLYIYAQTNTLLGASIPVRT